MTTRKIKKLTTGQRTIDGAGVHLVRVDRKSTRLNSSHASKSRMPSSA